MNGTEISCTGGSTELEAATAAASLLLPEKCNMWFSFARKLVDTSLAFRSHLPNPLLVSDPPSQYNTDEETADRVSQRRASACLLAWKWL